MKVSVVIATYNRALLIQKSIESVLQQSYSNFELLIIDDGSTDNTKSVAQSYCKRDSRVRYIALPENRGATTARNKGIEEATGDVIMVWDSDDELYPNTLQTVMGTFKKKPHFGIVSAPCRQQYKDGSTKTYRDVSSGEISLSQIVCKHLPDNEKIRIARANLMKQVSYESRNIDFIVNGYLASLGRWYHLSIELGVLHLELDGVSLTSNRKKPNIERSIERVEPLLSYFEQFGDLVKEHCPKRYAALSYGLAVGLLLKGQRNIARHYATEAANNDTLFLYKSLKFLTKIPCSPYLLVVCFKLRNIY